MKISLTLVFFLFLNPILDIHILRTIPVKADKIYTDGFNNIYVISENTLIKYNSEGKKINVFDSPDREKISEIDAKNPMKILLFFKNQNKILFLDNQLSKIGDEIYLENKNIFGDVLICSSESGGFWVIDISNNDLLKFDADYKEIFRKNLFEINSEPDYMLAENNSLYIKTKDSLIIIFDNLGNNNYTIEKKIPANFFIKGSNIQHFNNKENSLLTYNYETGDSTRINLSDTLKIRNLIQSSDYLIFNDNDKIYVAQTVNEKTDNR